MEKYKIEIESILNQALTEKTFTLEIIEKIKNIKDAFQKSQEIVKSYEESARISSEKYKKLEDQYRVLLESVEEYRAREKGIVEAEKKSQKQIYELEFANKRADEIKEILGIVFKNPIVRESVAKSISNGNGSYSNENSTITKELE